MNTPSRLVHDYCIQKGFSERVRTGGLDYLVDGWRLTVAAVIEGYSCLFDEYLNDMDSRRIIDELKPLADDRERRMLVAFLPALDEAFFKSTYSTDSCIWGADVATRCGYRPDQDWCYYRVPKNLSRVEDPERWPRSIDRNG